MTRLGSAFAICLIAAFFGCGTTMMSEPSTQGSDSSPQAGSTAHPKYLCGIWQWQWNEGGIIDHVVLRSDGSAIKCKDTMPANLDGSWHVDSQGMLQVRFPNDDIAITFRIDDEFSITDVATLPTERDFPWFKVHKLTTSLSGENIISLPEYN